MEKLKNDDVVVFNFPEGDSVATNMQERSYYEMVRSYGRERVNTDKRTFGDIIYRPVDKRENYIKRCIAIPGDSLKIVNGTGICKREQHKKRSPEFNTNTLSQFKVTHSIQVPWRSLIFLLKTSKVPDPE